jgi:hypothetical protein
MLTIYELLDVENCFYIKTYNKNVDIKFCADEEFLE